MYKNSKPLITINTTNYDLETIGIKCLIITYVNISLVRNQYVRAQIRNLHRTQVYHSYEQM